jgi:hypothetical protein
MIELSANLLKDMLDSDWNLVLSPEPSLNEIESQLAEAVNGLIQHDFNRLLMILYRIDINENRLRTLLESDQNQPAGLIIARLIIERQLQKIRTREQYKKTGKISDEESW